VTLTAFPRLFFSRANPREIFSMALFFLSFDDVLREFPSLSETDLFYLVLDQKKITAREKDGSPLDWQKLEGEQVERGKRIELRLKYLQENGELILTDAINYRPWRDIENELDYICNENHCLRRNKHLSGNPGELSLNRQQYEEIIDLLTQEPEQWLAQLWGREEKEAITRNAHFMRQDIEKLLAELQPQPEPPKTEKPPYLIEEGNEYYIPELAGLVKAWMGLYHDKTIKLEDSKSLEPIIDNFKSFGVKVTPQNLQKAGEKRFEPYLIRILTGGTGIAPSENLIKKLCIEK